MSILFSIFCNSVFQRQLGPDAAVIGDPTAVILPIQDLVFQGDDVFGTAVEDVVANHVGGIVVRLFMIAVIGIGGIKAQGVIDIHKAVLGIGLIGVGIGGGIEIACNDIGHLGDPAYRLGAFDEQRRTVDGGLACGKMKAGKHKLLACGLDLQHHPLTDAVVLSSPAFGLFIGGLGDPIIAFVHQIEFIPLPKDGGTFQT